MPSWDRTVPAKARSPGFLRGDPSMKSPRARSTIRGRICSSSNRKNGPGKDCSSRSSTPSKFPGVSNTYFLKAALNAIRKHRGLEELDAVEFLQLIKRRLKIVDIDQSLLNRPVNEGFSGGEKKRNEIFQMAVLEPTLAILDETDSGLDIDALRIVADGVNKLCDRRTTPRSSLPTINVS